MTLFSLCRGAYRRGAITTRHPRAWSVPALAGCTHWAAPVRMEPGEIRLVPWGCRRGCAWVSEVLSNAACLLCFCSNGPLHVFSTFLTLALIEWAGRECWDANKSPKPAGEWAARGRIMLRKVIYTLCSLCSSMVLVTYLIEVSRPERSNLCHYLIA